MSEYEYSKFGEWLDTEQDDIDPIIAQISDPQIAEMMLYMDWAGVDQDNEIYDLLRKKGMSKTISKAKEGREEQHLQMMTGLDRGSKTNLQDWQKYEKIKDLFRQEPKVSDFTNNIFQCFLFSSQIPPTGRGKSATMYTLSEFAKTVYPNIRIISNNPNDEFETVPRDWLDIEETIKEHDGWMLLLLDEVSQFLMYADQKAGKSVSNMLKLLRHNDTHLIGVGHTGADIPADIRRQVFVLDKHSETSGTLGYGIDKNGDEISVRNELISLQNIPMTNIDYDSKNSEPTVEIKFNKESGAKEKEEQKQCEGHKSDGDRCGTVSEYVGEEPYVGYCQWHEDQHPDYEDSDD